jgi:PhnB protein
MMHFNFFKNKLKEKQMARKKLAKRKKVTPKPKKRAVKKRQMKRRVKRARKKVLAIPKGYNNITPYLIVDNAMEAINFYKKIFGAKEAFRMDRPDGKVGHAELKIGDTKIMLADVYPEMGAHSPRSYGGSPVSIHLYIKNVDAVVQKAVSAGARLTKPVENMFYGDRSGGLEDPYGHKWYISTHVEDVTPAVMKKRMAQMNKH